jgi:hypothetical protein
MLSGYLPNCKYLAITIMTLTFFSREALVLRALLSAALLGFRSLLM